jgi:hypothetical protein
MKSIAEKEFPYNTVTDNAQIVFGQRKGYTHWAAFMEWANLELMMFDRELGIWVVNKDEYSKWDGMTTIELFEWWYNNVKDKP